MGAPGRGGRVIVLVAIETDVTQCAVTGAVYLVPSCVRTGDVPLPPLPARRLPPVRPGHRPARAGAPARARERVHRRRSRAGGTLRSARAGAAAGRQRRRTGLAFRPGGGAGATAMRRWSVALGLLLAGGAMAADVNLAKPGRDDPARWQGKVLGEVLD